MQSGASRGNSRFGVGLAAAVIGAILLWYSGRGGSNNALAFFAVVLGVILFVATIWFVSSVYRPGHYSPSDEELPHREWRWYQFLRFAYPAAAILLPIRLYVGYEWLSAGLEKVGSPVWTGSKAGVALTGFTKGAIAQTTGEHPSVQGWYGWFLQHAVLPNATLFSYMVSFGEVLVGIALILGFLTGVSAFFGGLMNANFLLAGAVSTNPILLALELVLIIAWRTAGWWGLDRWLIPALRPLWERTLGRSQTTETVTARSGSEYARR
ncbi:MAG: DoxX family membrane protein [Chloroflexota bacterium]|nr:DoxX family membrane protein [Chloroflexota bacterium]